MLDLLQILGALGVLIPFVWSQMGRMSLTSPTYLGLNLAGSALLAGLALHGRDWGFLLLEAVWALVALRGLIAPRLRTVAQDA
jgi:hypothetical protein